jgi:hypothetical protein
VQVCLDAGAEPTLAGDELVALVNGSHQDWLKHPMLAERIGQRGDLFWREVTPGLEWVRVNLIDGNVQQFGALERTGLEPPLLTS